MSIQQALSLLSPYIPAAIAAKGLGKISPNIQSFISSAVAGGYTMDAILGFLRKKLEAPGTEQERERLETGLIRGSLRPDEAASLERMKQSGRGAKIAGNLATTASALSTPLAIKSFQGVPFTQDDNLQIAEQPKAEPEKITAQQNVSQQAQQTQPRQPPSAPANFIAKHPELGAYLDGLIAKGIPPRDAALDAKGKRKFQPSIADIESNVGQLFEDLIAGLFQGSTQKAAPQQTQSQSSDKQAQLIALLKQLKQIRGQR